MSDERRLRIRTAMAATADAHTPAGRLCEACRSVVAVTGAGIMLFTAQGPAGSICTTSAVSALVEDLQFTLGEGPCVDAYHFNRPVMEPDLAAPAIPRWQAFSGPALDAGVRAVFGFPVGVGAVRIGALNLYADHPGPLSDEQHADALIVAEIAADAILVMQSGGSASELAPALEAVSDFHFVVHQAAGMVSAQLEVPLAQSLSLLRAHAFAKQRPLAEVAADVVERRLRFDGARG